MSWIELVAQRRTQAPQGMQPPENAADWYRIENSVEDPDTTDIYVYDSIGGWFGMYADEFIRDLKEVATRKINLRVNSPGGSVFEGIAIANALRSHPASVTVYVDALAASIASVIALAGDRLVMMPQSQLMIHDASGACYGNAEEMDQMARLLDKQSDNIADAYAARAGGTSTEWRDKMRAETWYSAKEAVEAGLADEVMPLPKKADQPTDKLALAADATRTWDLSMYRYAGRDAAPMPLEPVAAAPAVQFSAELKEAVQFSAELREMDLSAVIREAVRAELADLMNGNLPPWLKPDEEEEEETEDASTEEVEDASDPEPEDSSDPEEDPEASADPPEPDDSSDPEEEEDPEAAVTTNAADVPAGVENPVDTGLGDDDGLVESVETYDAWDQIVSRLTTESPSPSADDLFTSLKEAWT